MKDLVKLSKERTTSFYSEDAQGNKHYDYLTIMLYTEDKKKYWTIRRAKWNCNGTIYFGSITANSYVSELGATRFYDSEAKFSKAIKRLERKKEIIRVATI